LSSTSRESDQSVGALSAHDAPIASRQDALSLVERHRQCWRDGERLSVEAFLKEFPPLTQDDDELLDLIYNEVVLREEHGESPELDEYLRRFPQYSAELRDQFEVHRALQSGSPFSVNLSSASFDLEIPSPHSQAGTDPTRRQIASDTPAARAPLDRPKISASGVLSETDRPMLEGYDIQDVLGSGGMGTVFRAYDRERHRPVALKVMNRAGAAAILRFKNEFRTLLGVAHPNLVTLYELISDGRNWFLTMELLDGVTFLQYVRENAPPATGPGDSIPAAADKAPTRDTRQEVVFEDNVTGHVRTVISRGPVSPRSSGAPTIESQPLTPGQRVRLRAATRQLAEGIAWLHAAGKLHRDIKPTNVMVTREGRVVLLDFGLVAEQGRDGRHHSTEQHILGTAAYMAPEQAIGLPVSPATDWYSVGVMLFEALTGRLPFLGGPIEVLMDKQRFEPPAPCELAPGVPEDLDALCVDLLRRQPGDRPSARDVLRRLGSSGPVQEPGTNPDFRPSHLSSSGHGHGPSLVGRRHHRETLDEALAAMTGGRTVVLYLHGPSGAGKTALLRSFLDERIERGDAVVLAGRCYERESVPYKALDSLIDALGRHLRRLPEAEVAALLPRDMASLARVFPGLRQVEARAHAPRRVFESPDPQELRRRAFSALRELLARLGDRTPLILAIDDLQWGDVDSAALIGELLRPPEAPTLLFLGAYRSEDRSTSPFLHALFHVQASQSGGRNDRNTETEPAGSSSLDARELSVDPLDPDETRALANALLGEAGLSPGREALIEAIVRESAGNPFFVAELIRHVQWDDVVAGTGYSSPDPAPFRETSRSPSLSTSIALDDVLWARIRRLPEEARRVLEIIAVSGQPLGLEAISGCADLVQDERVSLALLTSGRLIRSTGRIGTDEIETYHDRVRETVVARLDPEVTREHHRRLALALEASGSADPEVLGVHLVGSGQPERAADYFARAADQAAEALAFDRAAGLYRRARDLQPSPSPSGTIHRLNARLGNALANAGRGGEAAAAYLAAVSDAPVADAIELQRRAAMQYLISGHIDEGLATLRTVLEAIGTALPVTPRQALFSLLAQRARLRLRGLGFRERDPSEIAPADLTRIDVCWSAGAGLSVVDTIRGADFQARGLLLSLAAGEPSRIARALAMEAAHAASAGGSNRRTTARLLDRAGELASRVEDPYALGMVALARGVSAYLEGRWTLAQQECDHAETIFRDSCTGVAWELDTAHAFALWGLSHQGAVAELSRRWPILLDLARSRGDLYAVMNLNSYIMSIVRLAADDPDTADRELRQTMSQWSREGYHVQHNDALWAAVQIELYRGDGAAAWSLIDRSWPALRRSLLLRVQFIRTSMHFLRARAALAAAVAVRSSRPAEARSLLAVARRGAQRLDRERMPCPTAYARLIHGALAAIVGDSSRAVPRLAEAVACFESVDMRLCAAASRRRLGECLGGTRGQEEIDRADRWMSDQQIKNSANLVSMIVTPWP
jgi:serine/threonine protein kinase/tetratricopeptide (TPR) repeat protein